MPGDTEIDVRQKLQGKRDYVARVEQLHSAMVRMSLAKPLSAAMTQQGGAGSSMNAFQNTIARTPDTSAVRQPHPLSILQVHCRYKSGLGGEDSVLHEEHRLLTSRGHIVTQFIGDNTSLVSRSLVQNGIDGLASVWNLRAARALAAEIASRRPDVIHVHNTFAALSPSVFWAAAKTHTPVVLTLHNYRLTCANGLLFRGSVPCMECVGRPPIAALQHRCAYNGSFPVGASICLTRIVHSLFRTYHRKVDAFIALTGFQRDLMIRDRTSLRADTRQA